MTPDPGSRSAPGDATVGERLARVMRKLSREVDALAFGAPVTHVYNPLAYARAAHERYLARYARSRPEAVFLGMNPGPWGMAQTGVPFGDVVFVRDWMGIVARVGRPALAHPRRPVLGFGCERREGSGQRVWGWAEERFGTARRFFTRFFVLNYCPLCFMEESGRNRTPDKLPAGEREPLFAACDAALRRAVDILEPRCVVGIGAFAEKRAREALGDLAVPVHRVLHPSPANPAANRGWAAAATRELTRAGIEIP